MFIQHVHELSTFTFRLLIFKLIANKRASAVYIRQATSWPRFCLSPLPLIPTHAMQKLNEITFICRLLQSDT